MQKKPKRHLRKGFRIAFATLAMLVCVITPVLLYQAFTRPAGRAAVAPASAGASSKAASSGGSSLTPSGSSAGSQSGVSSDNGSTLPAPQNIEKIVMIDPGHGGPDNGATGADGVREKDLNLTIAKKLKTALKNAGFSVVMTREDDRTICDSGCSTLGQKKDSDLNNRIAMMRQYPHAFFISIHQNDNPNPKYSGTQVYYSKNDPRSRALAKLIQSDVESSLQPQNSRQVQPPEKLRVLLKASIPAVLVECGFISNLSDAHSLEDPSYQDRFVTVLAHDAEEFYREYSNSSR